MPDAPPFQNLGGGSVVAEATRATAAELALGAQLAKAIAGANYGSGPVPARTTDPCAWEIFDGVANPIANMLEGDWWVGP